MPDNKSIDELTPEEIKSLLDLDDDLTDDQIVEIKGFLDRIGGIENAKQAIEMLSELEDVA